MRAHKQGEMTKESFYIWSQMSVKTPFFAQAIAWHAQAIVEFTTARVLWLEIFFVECTTQAYGMRNDLKKPFQQMSGVNSTSNYNTEFSDRISQS